MKILFNFRKDESKLEEKYCECLEKIKNYAVLSSNQDEPFTDDVIKNIIAIMKLYKKHMDIQKYCCKIISNICINNNNIQIICNNNGIQPIIDALSCNDTGVLWLACSAIWNICQIPQFRSLIGISGVNKILKILKNYIDCALVQETGFGALANLSVHPKFKVYIGKLDNLLLFYKIMKIHSNEEKVLTSICGLMTNLAHNEQISLLIGNSGGISHIITAMNNHKNNGHLNRNSCAALSNLSTSEDNFNILLKEKAIEILYDSYNKHDNFGIRQLANIALENLACDDGNKRRTSLHLASQTGKIPIIQKLLFDGTNIDVLDYNSSTPLHYAIKYFNYDVIEYLLLCGANPKELLPHNNGRIQQSIKIGIKKNDIFKKIFIDIISFVIPQDISKIIVSYINLVDYVEINNHVQEISNTNGELLRGMVKFFNNMRSMI